jgi:hypothetical protein
MYIRLLLYTVHLDLEQQRIHVVPGHVASGVSGDSRDSTGLAMPPIVDAPLLVQNQLDPVADLQHPGYRLLSDS